MLNKHASSFRFARQPDYLSVVNKNYLFRLVLLLLKLLAFPLLEVLALDLSELLSHLLYIELVLVQLMRDE